MTTLENIQHRLQDGIRRSYSLAKEKELKERNVRDMLLAGISLKKIE